MLVTVWTSELTGPALDAMVSKREGRRMKGLTIFEVHGSNADAKAWVEEKIREYGITLSPGHRELLYHEGTGFFGPDLVSGCVGSEQGDSFVIQRKLIQVDEKK